MNKIFVDLGGDIGTIQVFGEGVNKWARLDVHTGGAIDEGAYIPPSHIYIHKSDLKTLYDALKAIYEPTVEG